MADRESLITRFIEAWGARDVDSVMTLMAEECEFHTSVGPGPGTSYVGRTAVERAYRAFLEPPADPHVEAGPLQVMVSEDFAVTKWTSRTSRPGEDPSVVAACDIFVFDGDRIGSKDTYRKALGPAPC